jgi:hypothetical protein
VCVRCFYTGGTHNLSVRKAIHGEHANTAETSEFWFLFPFCTVVSTRASLLSTGNFFKKEPVSIKLFKQMCHTCSKKLCSEILGSLGTSETFVEDVLVKKRFIRLFYTSFRLSLCKSGTQLQEMK